MNKKLKLLSSALLLFGTIANAKVYDKTSYYVAYDANDPTQYVLVMPSVSKIYTHIAGHILPSDLKQIDEQFNSFPTYNNGEICFSALKSGSTGTDGANMIAGKCYDVKYFYIQKEVVTDGYAFMLYYKPDNRLYEGLAGKADTFKVVKDGDTVYASESITLEDYTNFVFDLNSSKVLIGDDVTENTTLDVTKAEILSGDITSDKTLTKDKLWKIDGLVKVRPGATLTIEPGTTIFGDNIGDDYIVVMKGAKIIADGTLDEPIIFTSEAALKDPTSAAPGQWGGLTILGGAPTNHANPHYEVDETDPDFAFGAANAGEGDPNDNSGIIRNVYVLNSGKTIGTDLEINGLSLAGVGAGTVVENVTVKNSSDDCIEIWGGTVNVKNAYLENCQDDSFDLDYGYVGHAKGILVKQVEPAHAGFEISSGGDNPMTKPVIENFVIEKVAYSDEGGIYIKDDTTAPTFINGTVKVDSTDVAIHTKKPATQAQLDTIAFKNVTLSPETFDGDAGEDIKTRWEANDAVDVSTAEKDVTSAVVLSGDITSDKTLTKDKLWKIDGLVKVRPGATLTIEPGTTIFGDNIGDDYIVVMKGAKIIADGTLDEPIIFTSEAALKDPTSAAPGQWGGLTILGGAPTNHANPHYEVDETDPDFAFGAANAGEGDLNDNSGIIRNVYVLNSGKTIGTDLEINGLSLAGVGAGTVVENVTVKNSSDDCIEIWGGTVNVKNAYLENCQDDSFDLDYGYVGHAKGILVKQVEPAHAGFEISSGGDNPMTKPVIENFVIEKVAYSDEGGIYIKDDTTAPTFINGTVKVDSTDVAIHTKKPATQAQLDTIAFKNVTLSPETFDGDAGEDIKTRWEANDAK
ncbi:hypothetical protein RZR97_09725 [Hydrogenimonas thermophila]|uniref:hypothetical protein n=1 Tax=Hydrogenimonas thermophila TaxID=223786 RepID=UPI0029372DEF|nr:hypothetical protein [Hydrogenimonas thermophila]WOE69384.1 hypothetical protein RZR91_09750 [Hydrogenimonas thermophila]WOE71894.1 hypothetical protein RZR97_09725 [Hydrogenimonas thermophila]